MIIMNRRLRIGFSLVELLAVIVIIGILSTISIVAYSRYIDKSKDEINNQNRNNLIIAAKAYIHANKSKTPKSIGEVVNVSASTLRELKYLNQEIKDKNGNLCDEKSYVRVYKYDSNNYSYLPYLICGDDVGSDADEYDPYITILLGEQFDIKNHSFGFKIKGNSTESNVKIMSYSYSISIEQNGNKSNIFNSGSLSAKGKTTISKSNLNLLDYINVSNVNEVTITVSAINQYGLRVSKSSSLTIADRDAPLCPDTVSGSTSWINKSMYESDKVKRTVSVECRDNNGSGCVKGTFTATWPKKDEKEVKNSVIKIKDNSGKENFCDVNAYVDIISPTVTVSAYNSSTSTTNLIQGNLNETNTSNGKEITVNYSNYKDNASGWLNKSKYSSGVYYKLSFDDPNYLKYVVNKKKKVNDSWVNQGSATESNDKTANINITDDGIWLITVTGYDEAGNTTIVKLNVKIDRTSPVIKVTVKDRLDGNDTPGNKIAVSEKTTSGSTILIINRSDYSNSVGSDYWLNYTNYPHGVVYLINMTDNIDLASYKWDYNNSGLKTNATDAELKKVNSAGTMDINGTSYNKIVGLSGNGARYGKFSVHDKAGNTATLEVYVNIDNTLPVISKCKTAISNGYVYLDTSSTNYQYSDALSGIKSGSAKYSVNNTGTTPSNNSGFIAYNNKTNFSSSCGNTYYAYSTVEDNAGNTSLVKKCSAASSSACTPIFTVDATTNKWQNVYNVGDSCTYWKAKINGVCPDSTSANVIARMYDVSYVDGKITFKWAFKNGPETWLGTGYTINLVVKKDGNDFINNVLKSDSESWGQGSYNSGSKTFSAGKGVYSIYTSSNSFAPHYKIHIGTITIS